MRDWLGKPLLLVAIILVVLTAFSVWYVLSGPRSAGAADDFSTPHQRQVDDLIRQIERGR